MARQPNDFYPTPDYATQVLLDEVKLPTGGFYLEPCVGDGSLIRKIRERRSNQWLAGDIVHPDVQPFVDGGRPEHFIQRDFREWRPSDMKAVTAVITNPQYSNAFGVVRHFVEAGCPFVAMLLRATFAGSKERNEWLRAYPCSAYVVPRRFRQFGGTDTVERYWFVWDRHSAPTFKIGRYYR